VKTHFETINDDETISCCGESPSLPMVTIGEAISKASLDENKMGWKKPQGPSMEG